MVRAIMDGTKTQTRRVIKNDRLNDNWVFSSFLEDGTAAFARMWRGHHVETIHVKPKYKKGDIIWVRETFQLVPFTHPHKYHGYAYRADWVGRDVEWRWKPSIFMPKDACRNFLKCTKVRVERLQDISEKDAQAEGAMDMNSGVRGETDYRSGFENIWEAINGRDSWDDNPFVFIYEFYLTEKPTQ